MRMMRLIRFLPVSASTYEVFPGTLLGALPRAHAGDAALEQFGNEPLADPGGGVLVSLTFCPDRS